MIVMNYEPEKIYIQRSLKQKIVLVLVKNIISLFSKIHHPNALNNALVLIKFILQTMLDLKINRARSKKGYNFVEVFNKILIFHYKRFSKLWIH